MSVTRLHTAADLLALGSDAPYELIEGELREVSPTNFRSSEVAANVLVALQQHVRQHRLGRISGSDAGYRIAGDPDTVLAPDVGFVRSDRAGKLIDSEFVPFAPDLAVEVMSTSDRFPTLDRKAMRYLEAGTRLVWVVRPDRSTVTVYANGREPTVLGQGDELSGEGVVPGFRLPLSDVFA